MCGRLKKKLGMNNSTRIRPDKTKQRLLRRPVYKPAITYKQDCNIVQFHAHKKDANALTRIVVFKTEESSVLVVKFSPKPATWIRRSTAEHYSQYICTFVWTQIMLPEAHAFFAHKHFQITSLDMDYACY